MSAVREALCSARARLVEASPLGEEVLEQVTVAEGDLRELERLATTGSASLRNVVARLTARPFGELTAGLDASVPTWAGAVGKRARLELEGNNQRVPAELATVLRSCLTHLVRNAIAHGIEPVAQRREVGKGELGTITLSARTEHGRIVIEVRDDGAGIDEANVIERAKAIGLQPSLQSIFEQGVSSRDEVSDLSGRGVGLSAVKHELADVGYEITVATEVGSGASFCIKARRGPRPVTPDG